MYSKQGATVRHSSSTLGGEQISSLIATFIQTYSLTTGTYKYQLNWKEHGIPLWGHRLPLRVGKPCITLLRVLGKDHRHAHIHTHTYAHMHTHTNTGTGHMYVHHCKLLNVTWKNLQLFQLLFKLLHFCLQIRSRFFQLLNLLLQLWLPGPWQWQLLSSCVLLCTRKCAQKRYAR